MLNITVLSVLLILVLAAPRCYLEPVPGSSKLADSNDRQERQDVKRSFRPENGSLNENVSHLNKSLMTRLIGVNRHRNLKNKEIKVEHNTLLAADLKPEEETLQAADLKPEQKTLLAADMKPEQKTLQAADLKPEQKIRQRRKQKSKENTENKEKFTPSYVVFILELIMVLMSNLCTHMIRIYKNSVPHVKLNIIIVISHYIVELGNIIIMFQVVTRLIFLKLFNFVFQIYQCTYLLDFRN